MRNPLLGALLSVALFGATGVAQGPGVTIKLKKDEVGDRTKQVIEDETNSILAVDANGQKQNKTEKKTSRYVFVEDVLAKPAGARKPTKLSRVYEVAESSSDGMKKTLSFQGKTVVIEKKGTKFEYTIDGKPLAEDEAQSFASEFGKGDGPEDEDILPTKPVIVGGTWEPNMEKLLPLMTKELPFDLAKTDNVVGGKLLKAYPKDGMQYGEFELKFDLRPTAIKQGDNNIPLKAGGKLTMIMRIDGCIDGTAHAGTMKNTMTADLEADLPNLTLKIQLEGKQVHTITPVKK